MGVRVTSLVALESDSETLIKIRVFSKHRRAGSNYKMVKLFISLYMRIFKCRGHNIIVLGILFERN